MSIDYTTRRGAHYAFRHETGMRRCVAFAVRNSAAMWMVKLAGPGHITHLVADEPAAVRKMMRLAEGGEAL